MARKGKLSKAERAEISRKNLRKAWKARGMKATFEPAAEPRRRKARRVAEPKAAPKRRVVRRAAEPAPAFVFEPARRRAAPKRRKAAKRRVPSYSRMPYAFEPALSTDERMQKMAMGWYRKHGTVPPHMIKYLPPGYESMPATAALPAAAAPAKRRAGRPRLPTAQLKKPRKGRKPTAARRKPGRPRLPTAQLKGPRQVRKPTATRRKKPGRPRLPTAQLKGPRRAAPAKRRVSTGLALRGGAGKGVIRSGKYKSAQTGQVIAIRRVYSAKNPAFETKHIAAGVGGLVLGVVSADLLDRFIATMAPSGTNTALTGEKAMAAIRSKSNAARMATSAGGAVVGFGTAYLLRHKSPTASYALGGFGLGFGVKFLTQLVTDVIMPVVFKVEDPKTDLTASRMYPDKQASADVSVTPPAPKPTGEKEGTKALTGVGRIRDMRRGVIYRLPPAITNRPVMQRPMQQQMGVRGIPDFGPKATRPIGVGCGGGSCSCGGGNQCPSGACHYPWENCPPLVPTNVSDMITPGRQMPNQPCPICPPCLEAIQPLGERERAIPSPFVPEPTGDVRGVGEIQVDVNAQGQIHGVPVNTGAIGNGDQLLQMMNQAASGRLAPYSHLNIKRSN